jgi:cyclohexyl-isocyanide hydratase
MTKLRVGILVFPKVQQLDLTGPFEVFASVPEAEVRLIWKRVERIDTATGLVLMPDLAFAECPQFDVLCVPGGVGVNPLMEDEEVLKFLRRQAEGARYVTSICTGSMVLAAAGLLAGRRATTHWASHDFLARLGAIPVQARVVTDGQVRNRRRRHRRDRYGACGCERAVWPGSRRGGAAQSRICARATVYVRPAGDRAG